MTTHIFEEGMRTISRNDDTKIEQAIEVGIQTAKRSLSRYNITEIFSAEGADKLKYAEIITYIKDIAKWHFIAVANVTADLELAENRYKSAIAQLKDIRNGETVDGWPLAEAIAPSTLRYGSRQKFNFE